MKPFLRWAGGKQWLSRHLDKIDLPEDGVYLEPFLGGGSVFLSLKPKRSILSDISCRLIEAYVAVRDYPYELIDRLQTWKNDARTYYAVRGTEFSNVIDRAAQLIFLNKTCWNGLYRVNREGQFNVPFADNGRAVFHTEHLLEVSSTLSNSELLCGDFGDVLDMAKPGDSVYLDPPYTVLHANNGFRRYNERLFSWNDQLRLAVQARQLADRGCTVLVSNADNPEVEQLYEGFEVLRIDRHSTLAADPSQRRKTTEALFVVSTNIPTSLRTRSPIGG